MSHIAHDKRRLTARLNRLAGQIEGVRRMVEQAAGDDDQTCFRVLQQMAAARGAMNGLMAELIEQHLEHHIVRVNGPSKRRSGAGELIRVLRSFSK